MQMNRRFFLRDGALAIAGTAAIPGFLTRSLMAQAWMAKIAGRRLVVIFQRGCVGSGNTLAMDAAQTPDAA